MSYQKPISANDPNAVEKLTAELEKAEKLQVQMKNVNAYWRKSGTCVGCPDISEEQARKIDDRIANAKYEWDKKPFDSYQLSNNNATIKRLQGRIKEISYDREVGFSGWEFEGGEAVANTELNRLQLIFDERPSKDQCASLKANGFKWAPSQGAWQRQLNRNAIYSANYISFVKPLTGEKPTELQPKRTPKNEKER